MNDHSDIVGEVCRGEVVLGLVDLVLGDSSGARLLGGVEVGGGGGWGGDLGGEEWGGGGWDWGWGLRGWDWGWGGG